MTSAVQKIGINLGGSSNDPVSFSTLRSTFFQSDPDTSVTGNTTVKASDLIRTTVLPDSSDTNGQTNPTCPSDGSKNGVPDATENASIVTTSSPGSNWKVSHFQQSVKWYNIVQSDTNENYDIDAQTWNSNLGKNIVKRMKVTGTTGSNSQASPASTFSASAYNLIIEVTGSILGYGGKGGGTSGAPAISGEAGGDALEVSSSSGKVVVDVKSTGKIYGGGGGGEKGPAGSAGSNGLCSYYSTTSGCGGAPGCPSGYYETGSGSGGCCQSTSYCCGLFNCGCERCVQNTKYRYCQKDEVSLGGSAGSGGNGASGRGYNNQSASLSGSAGTAGGAGGGCGATDGTSGGSGGDGGDWGSGGGNTTNSGSGGTAGKAVFGSNSNYKVIGTLTSSTIKGTY